MLLHAGQPCLDNAIGLVARLVKTPPQGMVGHAALIHFFPLLTQLAQQFLQFTRTVRTGWKFARCRTGLGGLCLHAPLRLLLQERRIRSGFGCSITRRVCVLLAASGGRHSRCLWPGNLPIHFRRRNASALRRRFAVNQRLGFLHQLRAQLVGTPALPALQLPSPAQCCLHLRFQRRLQEPRMHLHGIAYCLGGRCGIFSVSAAQFAVQRLHQRLHRLARLLLACSSLCRGLLSHMPPGFVRCALLCGNSCNSFTPPGAQFVSPYLHGWQRLADIIGCSTRLRENIGKGLCNEIKLLVGAFELARMAGLDIAPVCVLLQRAGLFMPVRHIRLQTCLRRVGILPASGGQQLNPLGQQHRRLALHLRTHLQVFNALDGGRQAAFEGQQRFLAQWRASLGGITLPGHGVGNVEPARLQQDFGLGRPFDNQHLLLLAALDFVELFPQRTGRPFVTQAELLVYLLHGCDIRSSGQPGAHPGRAFSRSSRAERASCQLIQGMCRCRFGGGSLGLSGRLGGLLSTGCIAGSAKKRNTDHDRTIIANKMERMERRYCRNPR